MSILGDGRYKPPPLPAPKNTNELIREVAALKRKPRHDEAANMIHKLASLVKPIMRNHGFKVGKLVEFFPKNPSLLGLNVNHGMKICVRLRPHHNESTFYPMEEIIGTMLHELTHNKFGPHDQKFYAYLDKLKEEYISLAANGWKGDGFNSEGVRLGAGTLPQNVNLSEARRIALKAAEKRATLAKGSDNKLGGTKQNKPLAVLVREAAERRARDNKWCPDPASLGSEDMGEDSDIEVLENSPSPSVRVNQGESSRPAKRQKAEVVVIDVDEEEDEGEVASTLHVDLTSEG